jgi:hypothetical protein
MDPRLPAIAQDPANTIFAVVFFPDRIYHQEYLNATRSPRYRYNVHEVRGYLEVLCLKGQVFLDGALYCNFIRIEYRGSRLTEAIRVKNRMLRNDCSAWIRITDKAGNQAAVGDRLLKLHWDDWVNAYQAEIWETLEPADMVRHDTSVLAMMGSDGQITRLASFVPLLKDVASITKVELAFREPRHGYPSGNLIAPADLAWDNNLGRTHQAPIKADQPSAPDNTVQDLNYLLDFQRGWYQQASDIVPVLYRNAMMLADSNGVYTNPDARPDNIIAMRWLFQRELGGSMIFFHEVTIPPGKVEGNHQHVGSEELYYIVEGTGVAYLRVGDDPDLGDETDARYKTVEREVFGLGTQKFKELPVKPGSMIFTKSGGMHGIRNPPESQQNLKFVAFLYHSA